MQLMLLWLKKQQQCERSGCCESTTRDSFALILLSRESTADTVEKTRVAAAYFAVAADLAGEFREERVVLGAVACSRLSLFGTS